MSALTSEGILPVVDQDLQGRAAMLREGDPSVNPMLGIVTDNLGHRPTERYVDSLITAGREAGILVVRSWMTGERSRGEVEDRIDYFNDDPGIHGVVVTVPLRDGPEHTDEVLARIKPEKAIDGQGPASRFRPGVVLAIPTFLDQHMDEYGFDFRRDSVAILGKGMVGGNLLEHMREAGATDVQAFDAHSEKLDVIAGINRARVVVSATGQRGIVTSELFEDLDEERVLIDLGGEFSDELRQEAESHDALHITSTNNGVGRLTGRMVISNLLTAAESRVEIAA